MLTVTSLKIKKHVIANQVTQVIHTQAASWNLLILVCQTHVGPMLSVQSHHRVIPCACALRECLVILLAPQAVVGLNVGRMMIAHTNLPALRINVVTHALGLVA